MITSHLIDPMVTLAGTVEGGITTDLMAGYRLDEFHSIKVVRHAVELHRTTWRYELHCDDELIFTGADFSTPGLSSPGEAARSILAFLTLRPGDVESEYFDSYTSYQIAWRDAKAEDLSMFAMSPDAF